MGRRLFLFLFVLLFLVGCAPVNKSSLEDINVFYAGPDGSVKTALKLAKFTLLDDPSQADVLVLNGKIPSSQELNHSLQAGKGGVLILGAEIKAEDAGLILGSGVSITSSSDPLSLKVSPTSKDGITKDVLWSSSPQIRERAELKGIQLDPLVISHETGETILGKTGKWYVFSAFLDGANPQIQEWAYFNYLIYNLASRAAGEQPLSFGDFPASPVPHPQERLILYLLMALLLVITASVFLVVRRYSLAHPEVLNTFVIDRKVFEKNEAGTDWENIGFHRVLGGFMFAVMTGLVLFIPYMIYQNLILPGYILPSAQAMGIWSRVAAFFPIVWSVFDMGTSVAHIKFFAQYRVHDPQRAIKYAQFFVWWQTLSGAVQVALVVALSGAFLPNTIYAMYIWAIVAHTLIQIPGFYMIISDSLTSLQRSDYNQILDMSAQMVIPMLTQPIIITLFVWWGRTHPVFGFAMGGVLGLGAAAYASAMVAFLFGLWLYRHIGYNARLLFLAHFDWEIAKESLKLGIFLVVSGLIGGLASSLQVLLIQSRLINTNEVLGNLGLAGSFVFAYSVILTLTGNAMPAISEAISNGRKLLGQYYAAAAYKYGGMISAFICAMLLSVADRFILGSSGKEFERAAVYAIPLLISGALSFATWIGDIMMFAAKKTQLVTLLAVLDFSIGLGGAFLLVDRFQVTALIAVPFITTTTRMLLVYYLNNRYCFPQKYYFWQSAAAPFLAASAHFLVLRGVTGLIWQGDELTSILILLIAILPAYPLYAFFYGLFGGWDDNTLAEFGRGTNLSGFARPMTRLFYHATKLGTRVSPLHARFPITIYELARAEAASLTKEKVSFVQD